MKYSCLFVFLVCFFSSCREKAETTRPVVQAITESVYAAGKVKSKNQYEVFAPVNGIIREVFVSDGSLVKKGEVLMTLISDAPELNSENARLSAEYQSVNANLSKLNEARASINLAQSKLQNDSLLLQRQRELWANDIGSRNELEQKELALKNSYTAYQTAILHYRQLKQQLEFAEKQAKTTFRASRAVTNDYSVRATRDGKVYALSKEPGETVNPQVPVAVIGNAHQFILELQVDEYDIAKIRIGQKAVITMDSYKGHVFEAVVTKINPIMNERTRSVTIEATFTKEPVELLPNLSAEANVLINTREHALTIPRNYLVDETYVLLQNGEKRKVTVGLKDYQRAEITNGLKPGDLIQKPVE
jgi:HlyD family secretion protein